MKSEPQSAHWHRRGIGNVLDVVLNHSGEGDALRAPRCRCVAWTMRRYYRARPRPAMALTPTIPVAAIHSRWTGRAPLRMMMDALRLWAQEAGRWHGFQFDLATTLGRRSDGFDPAAPLLSAIAQDPVLRKFEVDCGAVGYWFRWVPGWCIPVRLGRVEQSVPRRRASVLAWRSRSTWGARDAAGRLGGFVRKSEASPRARSTSSLRMMDLRLADLVSYMHKVNAANGEANRDGTDANFSWNNGVEGPSADPAILAARRRDQRALLATLILARGTPMLTMGSEFGHSQDGNNNAYAQDNPIAWLDWASADAGLLDWTRQLLRIRWDHPLFRGNRFLTGASFDFSALPDVEWRDAQGRLMTPAAWQAAGGNTLVMILAGASGTDAGTDRVAVALHRGPTDTSLVLPSARIGHDWYLIADSSAETHPDAVEHRR